MKRAHWEEEERARQNQKSGAEQEDRGLPSPPICVLAHVLGSAA